MATQARKFAAEGKWLEAVELNSQLVERSPRDVDALNRLGKAYFELGQYRSAYETYQRAVEADPANIIARRNLERLEPLRDQETSDTQNPEEQPPARFGAFVEEAGTTYVDDIINPAPSSVLRTLTAGERLEIDISDQKLSLLDQQGQYIGTLEPRIVRRLIWLMEMGNTYEVFVTANAGDRVRVIIRETSHSPDMGGRLSFPHQGRVAVPRAYLSDSRLFRGEEESLVLGSDEDEELDESELDVDEQGRPVEADEDEEPEYQPDQSQEVFQIDGEDEDELS